MQPQPTLPASCWRVDVDHFGQGLESGAASECIGDIEFITGVPQAFSRNSVKTSPKVGDLYVFPAWLHHTAYPFRTKDQERRSISFNIIYNIDQEKLKDEKMLVDKE